MLRSIVLLTVLVLGLSACLKNKSLQQYGHTIVEGDSKKTVLITLGPPVKKVLVNKGEVGEIWHYCHTSKWPFEDILMALWIQNGRVIDLKRYYSSKVGDCRDFLRHFTWEGHPVPERIAKGSPGRKGKGAPAPSTGSGFLISGLGHIVTNAHVVDGCGALSAIDHAGRRSDAELVDLDHHNDLALLRLKTVGGEGDEGPSERKTGLQVVPARGSGVLRANDVALGERVIVAGFPFGDIFSSSIKVTGGLVSATRGFADNTGQFQLDAAVQPGNSGGPIYDESGNIVGVVVSQLSKLKVAKATGSLPENVNFGIKASTVSRFLSASGLSSQPSRRSETLSTKDIARIGERQTVMVLCRGP